MNEDLILKSIANDSRVCILYELEMEEKILADSVNAQLAKDTFGEQLKVRLES
jgi:hypothetical protein